MPPTFVVRGDDWDTRRAKASLASRIARSVHATLGTIPGPLRGDMAERTNGAAMAACMSNDYQSIFMAAHRYAERKGLKATTAGEDGEEVPLLLVLARDEPMFLVVKKESKRRKDSFARMERKLAFVDEEDRMLAGRRERARKRRTYSAGGGATGMFGDAPEHERPAGLCDWEVRMIRASHRNAKGLVYETAKKGYISAAAYAFGIERDLCDAIVVGDEYVFVSEK